MTGGDSLYKIYLYPLLLITEGLSIRVRTSAGSLFNSGV